MNVYNHIYYKNFKEVAMFSFLSNALGSSIQHISFSLKEVFNYVFSSWI